MVSHGPLVGPAMLPVVLDLASECPQLLVIGGGTTAKKTLKNAWTFDLATRKWKAVR